MSLRGILFTRSALQRDLREVMVMVSARATLGVSSVASMGQATRPDGRIAEIRAGMMTLYESLASGGSGEVLVVTKYDPARARGGKKSGNVRA